MIGHRALPLLNSLIADRALDRRSLLWLVPAQGALGHGDRGLGRDRRLDLCRGDRAPDQRRPLALRLQAVPGARHRARRRRPDGGRGAAARRPGPLRRATCRFWAVTSWLALRYGLTREDREALGGLSRGCGWSREHAPMTETNPVLAYGAWLAETPDDWPEAAWNRRASPVHRHRRGHHPRRGRAGHPARVRDGPGLGRRPRHRDRPGRAALAAPWAALVNGTAAHALDFDDNFDPAKAHATAVLAPAILALAEQEGASGRALPRRLYRRPADPRPGRPGREPGAPQPRLARHRHGRRDRRRRRLRAAAEARCAPAPPTRSRSRPAWRPAS